MCSVSCGPHHSRCQSSYRHEPFPPTCPRAQREKVIWRPAGLGVPPLPPRIHGLFSLPDTQSLAWHPSCWTMAGWTGRDVRLSGQNQDTGLAQHIQMLSLIQGSLYKRKRKPRGGELPSTVCV